MLVVVAYPGVRLPFEDRAAEERLRRAGTAGVDLENQWDSQLGLNFVSFVHVGEVEGCEDGRTYHREGDR